MRTIFFLISFILSTNYIYSQNLNSYSIVGGGAFCQGTTGNKIWLDGSDLGISYELVFNDTFSVISDLPGTGDSVYFGHYAVTGFYTVVAHDTINHLVDTMNGRLSVTMINRPQAFSISGGGNICEGSNGPAIFLSGSQSSVLYDMFLNDTILVSTFAGNGSSLFLGNYNLSGTYTLIGRNASIPTCPNSMNGNAVINVFPHPNQLTLQGNGTFCQGSQGASLFIYPSELNISYTLYNGANSAVATAQGNGDTLYFNPVSQNSNYTSIASRLDISGCTTSLTGSISVNSLNQTIYTVNGGGLICEGSSGATILLSGSQIGYDYYWENGSLDSSSILIPGNGGALVFDSVYLEGTFNVWSIHHSLPNCLLSMAGTATVQIQNLPEIFNLTGGGFYCEGQQGIEVGLDGSENNVNYQLYLNQTLESGINQTGTGQAISFGLVSLTGNYTVSAEINGCRNIFPSSVEVGISNCTSLNEPPFAESNIYKIDQGVLYFSERLNSLQIMDSYGKIVYLGNYVSELDVRTLENGVFILLTNGNVVSKLLINR